MKPGRIASSIVGLLSLSAAARALDPIGTTCTRTVQSVEVASGFDGAVFATAPPNDFDRLFVVELPGQIRIVKNDVLLSKPFLDISDLVVTGCEQGLFSVAFHPDFANNGFFYVNYTNPDTIVARYHVSDDPDVADPASALTMLTVAQPECWHNGGQLQFGPKDGYLYIGMGDGGGDPTTSQIPRSLLGKMLRLDVDNPPTYVPADNPFVGDRDPLEAVRDEIWAFGLRNPWRFSFDRLTGDLYIGDVGELSWEEIDVQPAGSVGGENYGWPCFEGNAPYHYRLEECLLDPTFAVWSFSHRPGCAVFGGYVYRGAAIPALYGRYFYSDYCGHFVKTFEYQGGRAMNHHDFTGELATGSECLPLTCYSFGEDAAGELYCCAYGAVYKFVPPTVTQGDAGSLRRDGDLFSVVGVEDCNSNCVPDDCDVAQGRNDCNGNGIPDDCDVANGTSPDCNGNGLSDACELNADCNNNGTQDICDIFSGLSADCNLNGVPDSCDIANRSSQDTNGNFVPDECEEGACCQCDGSCALRTRRACTIVSGFLSGPGSSCGDVICGAPNDDCADRTILPSNANVTVPFENHCATTDGPSTINCDTPNEPIRADLWYQYVAPCTGSVRASLCGTTQFDSILAVYGGGTTCDCQQIFSAPLACGDDTCGIGGGPSQVTVSATAGRCYLIRVAGWYRSTGNGELQISYDTFCEPPGDCDGDHHVDAHDMAHFQNCYTGANGGPIPPGCACVELDGDDDVDLKDWGQFVQAITGP